MSGMQSCEPGESDRALACEAPTLAGMYGHEHHEPRHVRYLHKRRRPRFHANEPNFGATPSESTSVFVSLRTRLYIDFPPIDAI